MVEISEPDLAAARCVLEILLTDPRWLDWFGSGDTDAERERRDEIYDFANHMLTVAQSIADQARLADKTALFNLPEFMQKPRGVESVLFAVSRNNKAKFTQQPLRLLIAAAAGEIHQLGVVTSARSARTEDRTNKNHRGRVQQSAPNGCNRAVL
jgi:hypothetical protein